MVEKKVVQLSNDRDKTTDYHVMNIPIPIPDYTVTTQLLIHSGDSEFTVDVVVHCYPSAKRVTVEPIDKATIRKKVV